MNVLTFFLHTKTHDDWLKGDQVHELGIENICKTTDVTQEAGLLSILKTENLYFDLIVNILFGP